MRTFEKVEHIQARLEQQLLTLLPTTAKSGYFLPSVFLTTVLIFDVLLVVDWPFLLYLQLSPDIERVLIDDKLLVRLLLAG